MGRDFHLCGWRVFSELPLPSLLPWSGGDRPVDVTVRIGTVPESLPGAPIAGPFLQVDGAGTCRFAVPGVAAYLIRAGREIVVDPCMPADAPDIELFLLGTPFGVLCHQRGMLPLHASCVGIGERTIAIAGPSGTGKSTLAAALVGIGHRFLADDVTVLGVSEAARPVVWPGFPRQKLWRDSLTALRLDPGPRLRTAQDMEKFGRVVDGAYVSEPRPLTAVCYLCLDAPATEPSLEPLSRLKAIQGARNNLYRLHVGESVLGQERIFRSTAAMAATVPSLVLSIPSGLGRLGDVAAALPRLLAERLP